MGTRHVFKNIISFFLLFSGLASGVMIYPVTKARMAAAANSYNMMLAADIIIFIYALIFLVCGLLALVRRIPRRVIQVRPFVQVGVFLAVLQLIISSINGILVNHLIILACAGVLVPQIFCFLITALMARK